jgi:plasmid replication initiation protein
MKNLKVCKSNSVIEAGYRLTLNEQRLILACIGQVNSINTLTKDEPFTLRAQDYAKLFNLSEDRAYSELKKVSDKLFSREITIYRPTEGKQYLKTRWISSIAYGVDTGEVDIHFSTEIIPYLSGLKKEFTQYNLTNIANMTSIYAIRLYEILIQWKNIGIKEIELTWLKKHFEIEGKYKAIKDLKKYVIKPALEQIDKHSDLWVKYDQKKRGRKITHFIFTFGLKEPSLKKLDFSPAGLNEWANAPENKKLTMGKTDTEIKKMMKQKAK